MARRLRCYAVLVGVGVFLWALAAGADDKVDRLAKKLSSSSDFRVRTQAALALGASGSERAVKPLCDGLEDPSTTVRAASAAALGKLQKGGEQCLEDRLSEEKSRSVVSVIKKALERVGGAAPAEITASTKYYIAVADVSDKSDRKDDSAAKIVLRAIRKGLPASEGFVLAPSGETATEAKKVLGAHPKVVGFYLTPKVLAPSYSGDSLKVKIQLTVFTYPAKALKGMLPKSMTAQGVSGRDRATEDELIELAVERAVKQFLENIERFQ